MDRIKNLNRFQKGILILLAVMAVGFAAVYSIVISRVGFDYQNAILLPREDNGNTVYSGEISGESARFLVTADKNVIFYYAEKTYGPYSVKEDPTAIPKDHSLGEHMTGVEIRKGEEVIFRGGVFRTGGEYSYLTLVNEDGAAEHAVTITSGNGAYTYDSEGNLIDPMEPSASTILELVNGPKLTHKGHWAFWFLGVFASVLTVVSIAFADEVFRIHLRYRIRNADLAEPSDWEIASRYITWVVMVIGVLIVYIFGLQRF